MQAFLPLLPRTSPPTLPLPLWSPPPPPPLFPPLSPPLTSTITVIAWPLSPIAFLCQKPLSPREDQDDNKPAMDETSPINVPTIPPHILDEHEDNTLPPPILDNFPGGGAVLPRPVENINPRDTSPLNVPTVPPSILEECDENTLSPPILEEHEDNDCPFFVGQRFDDEESLTRYVDDYASQLNLNIMKQKSTKKRTNRNFDYKSILFYCACAFAPKKKEKTSITISRPSRMTLKTNCDMKIRASQPMNEERSERLGC